MFIVTFFIFFIILIINVSFSAYFIDIPNNIIQTFIIPKGAYLRVLMVDKVGAQIKGVCMGIVALVTVWIIGKE